VNTIFSFKAGDRVEYLGKAKPELAGRTATVHRTVKSRKVVTILWDADGKLYDAWPTGLKHIEPTTLGAVLASLDTSTPATEPTEQGLQYVIPGCEKDRTRGPVQGDLF